MERDIIRRHFESIGARVRFRDLESEQQYRHSVRPDTYRIDIVSDNHGSIFDIAQAHAAPELVVLQKCPKERHLLLYSRDGQRFLCGHDERDWFIAAVPKRVSTVRDARLALMPREVSEKARTLAPVVTRARKNGVFVRQGEWFFVPVEREFPEELILRNEPLQRTARSKPHVCEKLYRENGEFVYVVQGQVFTPQEYKARKAADKWFGKWGVGTRIRNPEIYVRGHVRHADHATVYLDRWHRVYINAELTTQGPVAYLD